MSADWPDDEEMAERCYCGHTLGQHSYGADPSPCDCPDGPCGCRGFEPSHAYMDARMIAKAAR